jgi:hypothetical protein
MYGLPEGTPVFDRILLIGKTYFPETEKYKGDTYFVNVVWSRLPEKPDIDIPEGFNNIADVLPEYCAVYLYYKPYAPQIPNDL